MNVKVSSVVANAVTSLAVKSPEMTSPRVTSTFVTSADERLCSVEEKLKAQDGELVILKSTLVSVLSRLNTLEGELQRVNILEGELQRVNILEGELQRVNTLEEELQRLKEKQVKECSRKPPPAPQTNNSQRKPGKSSTKPAELLTTLTLPNGEVHALNPTQSNGEQHKKTVQRDKSRNKECLSLSFMKPRGKSMNDLSTFARNETRRSIGEDNGEKKLILAKNMPKRKYTLSGSRTDLNLEKYANDVSVKFNIRGRLMTFYPPTATTNQNAVADGSAPDESLDLKWVYGYRGMDCRNNLYCLSSGELMYNMAAVVILYNTKAATQRHYTQHSDDVKCITIHPNQTLVASGQAAGHGADRKPHVLIWDCVNLQTLKSLGHNHFERAVCAVEFSTYEDGKYLLAFDESDGHAVYVFDWQKETKLTETNVSKAKLLGVKWNPRSPLSFVTYGKSHLMFWTMCVDQQKVYLTKKAAIYDKISQPKFVQTVVYTDNGDALSGDSNGNILLFSENRNRVSASASAHKGGVFCISFLHKDGVVISSGKHGQISTWTTKLQKLKDFGKIGDQYGPARSIAYNDVDELFFVGTTRNCILQYDSDLSTERLLMQGHSEEMWGLACHQRELTFATCAQDGLVCVWNCESMASVWQKSIEDAAHCVEFHPNLPYLLVGCKTGKVFFLNYESKEEVSSLRFSKESIDDIKVSPDGKAFATACRDALIYVYTWAEDISTIKKPKILQGHTSRVLHLDWSTDGRYLQSNSSDYELLFWDKESGSHILNSLRDVSWETWTCPIGYAAMGIWPEGADGTVINSCTRSGDNKLLATGDNFGLVKLFRYPCIRLKSENRIGRGHSSYVTCVRFLSSNNSVVTVGGKDCTVMQWQVTQNAEYTMS